MKDDIIITIATYRRPELLVKLLDNIKKYWNDIDIMINFQGYDEKVKNDIIMKYKIDYYISHSKGITVTQARRELYYAIIQANKKSLVKTYKYILDLDDDVLLKRGYIEILYNAMEKFGNIGNLSGAYQWQFKACKTAKYHIVRSPCPCCAKMIRVDFLSQFIDEIFDKDLYMCDDVELAFQMFKHQHECCMIGTTSFIHKLHSKEGGINKEDYKKKELEARKYLSKKYDEFKISKKGAALYLRELIKKGIINKKIKLK